MQEAFSDADVRAHLKSLTELYVEDENFTREMCSEFLSRLVGFLICAKNGREGLDAYQERRPDIVVTDIQMPIMDGLEMVQEIRTRETGRGDKPVPVIVMAAFEESDIMTRSISLGVRGYENKPLNINHFHSSLLECAPTLLIEKIL
jgi:CheY-like chemotaxis protein